MNQNGGIHKGGFAVLCHRNGGSESPGILKYIVENYDGVYFGVRSHTGLYHRVSPWRMFHTREEAIEALSGQESGGISFQQTV